jgi:hypothetical protein
LFFCSCYDEIEKLVDKWFDRTMKANDKWKKGDLEKLYEYINKRDRAYVTNDHFASVCDIVFHSTQPRIGFKVCLNLSISISYTHILKLLDEHQDEVALLRLMAQFVEELSMPIIILPF